MSIRIKERGEFEDFNAGCVGTLTTGSLCGIYMIPFDCVLKGILARLGTAGGTQATIVDVQLSDQGGAFASIFSGATKVNFASGSQTPTYGTVSGPGSSNPADFEKGDIVKVVITQVGSGPAPADLAMALNFQRLKGTGVTAATQLDTVGKDAEY